MANYPHDWTDKDLDLIRKYLGIPSQSVMFIKFNNNNSLTIMQ